IAMPAVTEPPGELMYRWMSLSGSSASRNNICAMTRFAISSSIYVGRKMMRSLRSREKMSNARSPRGVCSTTIGTKPIERLLRCARRGAPPPSIARSGCMALSVYLRRYRGPFNKEVERALLPEREAEAIQVTVLLEQRAHGGHRSLAGLREALHLGIDVGVARRQPFLFGDGLDQEGSLHGLLGTRAHLLEHLLVVPGHPLRIHALAAHLLADMLDLVADLAQHHRFGHLEGVHGQRRLDHRIL